MVRIGTASGGIRWDRIRIARARIASGFYDRPEVVERLAEEVHEVLRPR